MTHDSTARSIIVASAVVLSIAILALIAGALVPFDVEQPATVQTLTGTVDLITTDRSPDTLPADTTATLEIGQSVRTQPDSAAMVTFELTQGRALLEGDTLLTLNASYRHATSLGHTLNRDHQTHTLTLEQTRGRVRYVFANTTPPFSDIQLVIELPDGNYLPETPCWEISVDMEGHSTIETLTCPTD